MLSRGLIFSTTIQPNSFQLFKDLNKFIRNLTLKKFFHIQSNKITEPPISPSPTPTDINLEESVDSPFSVHNDEINVEDPDSIDSIYELFTQHLQTSPPVAHTSLKPKSSFYPTKSKGPYLEAFYRVVFADF